ncbi:MAG: hypothetical protein AAGD10_10405 [Myxococcota bacterium]
MLPAILAVVSAAGAMVFAGDVGDFFRSFLLATVVAAPMKTKDMSSGSVDVATWIKDNLGAPLIGNMVFKYVVVALTFLPSIGTLWPWFAVGIGTLFMMGRAFAWFLRAENDQSSPQERAECGRRGAEAKGAILSYVGAALIAVWIGLAGPNLDAANWLGWAGILGATLVEPLDGLLETLIS